MARIRLVWTAVLAVSVGMGAPRTGFAQQPADRLSSIEQRLETYTQRLTHLDVTYVMPAQEDSLYQMENRLADGRVLFLLEDYSRAAVVLLDIVETSTNRLSPGYSEARYYLAESLCRDHNLIAAQGYFREIADDPRDSFRQDAILRLLEIAFTMRRYDEIERLDRLLDSTSGSDLRPDIRYAHAKTLYFRGDYSAAAREFAAIPQQSEESARASYFLGICYVRMDEWEAALNAFQAARDRTLQSTHPDAAEIADLASMALGRVFFELSDYPQALSAYQSVSRTSGHFDRALYEMAWVYIKLDRYRDALRTLEIMTLAVPESQFLPHVQLIRGDLLIRLNEYQDAMEIFETTVERFGPLAEQLADVVEESRDPDLYYNSLIDTRSASLMLPDLAREWVEQDEYMRRALTLVRDLEVQRAELRESREIIEELEAVLNSASRVEIFSELESGYGQAIEIRFGLLALLADLSEVERELVILGADAGQLTELATRRQRRLELARQMATLPLTYEEMVAREQSLEGSIQDLEMEVYRLGYALDTQRMQLMAMRQQLREERAAGWRSADEYHRLNETLDGFAATLDELEDTHDALRRQLELERLQTGVGSVTTPGDGDTVAQYERALDEERQALERCRSGMLAADLHLAERIDGIRTRIGEVRQQLEQFFRDIDRVVDQRTREIVRQIAVQDDLVEQYERRLEEYGVQGEQLCGLVAHDNFMAVQNRFQELILRADVGIIDVAWREKEDRTERIENLLDVRDSQLDVLDAEFREVLENQ